MYIVASKEGETWHTRSGLCVTQHEAERVAVNMTKVCGGEEMFVFCLTAKVKFQEQREIKETRY